MGKNIVEITREFLSAKVAEGKITAEEMEALLAIDEEETPVEEEGEFTSLERVAMGYTHGYVVRVM